MVVLGGVAAWRLVAAADMAAFLAHAKVHPVMPPGGHALHAAWSRRRDVMDVVEVPAHVTHLVIRRSAFQFSSSAATAYVLSRKSCIAPRGSAAERTAS